MMFQQQRIAKKMLTPTDIRNMRVSSTISTRRRPQLLYPPSRPDNMSFEKLSRTDLPPSRVMRRHKDISRIDSSQSARQQSVGKKHTTAVRVRLFYVLARWFRPLLRQVRVREGIQESSSKIVPHPICTTARRKTTSALTLAGLADRAISSKISSSAYTCRGIPPQ